MQPRSGDGQAAPASHGQLAALCEDFPQFRIWQEIIGDRARYIACRQQPGLHPHTVITDDLAEMRAALESSRRAALIPFSPDVPNVARMYDFFIGGKDHLQADRAAALAVLRRFPEVAGIARANRAFQAQAVRHAAGRGITQFIDLGAGLPTAPSTHHSARAIAPAARVAYVDNDAVVIAHSWALLAVDRQIAVVAADLRDPAPC